MRRPALCAFAAAVAVTALACAARLDAAPLGRVLHPLSAQTTDQAIASDLALLDAWQAKLDGLTGADQDLWRRYAARDWLDLARHEYQDNDRTGFPQAALTRAITLIGEIERGAAPLTSKTVPAATLTTGSLRVAESLYVALDHLKRDPGFLCAADELAALETQLAWAGNELLDQGECNARPHVAQARDLARLAAQKVELCKESQTAAPRAPQPVAPIASADTVVVPKGEFPTAEELKIPRNVHFALNRFDITPTSRGVIEGIAALLTKYPSVSAHLVGYTDSRGDSAYNLKLSQRRALAARAVFLELGIDSTRLSIAHKGKADLTATEDSKRGFALNRRVEMVFVDNEGREIQATSQEGDLSIESDRVPRTVKPRKAAPRAAIRDTSGVVTPARGAHPAAAPTKPLKPRAAARKGTLPGSR